VAFVAWEGLVMLWKSRVSDKVEGLNDSFAQKEPGSKT